MSFNKDNYEILIYFDFYILLIDILLVEQEKQVPVSLAQLVGTLHNLCKTKV